MLQFSSYYMKFNNNVIGNSETGNSNDNSEIEIVMTTVIKNNSCTKILANYFCF